MEINKIHLINKEIDFPRNIGDKFVSLLNRDSFTIKNNNFVEKTKASTIDREALEILSRLELGMLYDDLKEVLK